MPIYRTIKFKSDRFVAEIRTTGKPSRLSFNAHPVMKDKYTTEEMHASIEAVIKNMVSTKVCDSEPEAEKLIKADGVWLFK
jgi:hypothetical protein